MEVDSSESGGCERRRSEDLAIVAHDQQVGICRDQLPLGLRRVDVVRVEDRRDVLMRDVEPSHYGSRVDGARVEAFDDLPSKTDWDRMEAELEAFRAAEDDRDAEREAIEREATAAASRERIIAAAVQVEGVTLSLPIPARHGEVISSADAMHLPEYAIHGATQGFLTSACRLVNRVQAKQIAHMAGQPQLRPEHERHQRDLFSEDLW